MLQVSPFLDVRPNSPGEAPARPRRADGSRPAHADATRARHRRRRDTPERDASPGACKSQDAPPLAAAKPSSPQPQPAQPDARAPKRSSPIPLQPSPPRFNSKGTFLLCQKGTFLFCANIGRWRLAKRVATTYTLQRKLEGVGGDWRPSAGAR